MTDPGHQTQLFTGLQGIQPRSSSVLTHRAIFPPNRLLKMGLEEYLLCFSVLSQGGSGSGGGDRWQPLQ